MFIPTAPAISAVTDNTPPPGPSARQSARTIQPAALPFSWWDSDLRRTPRFQRPGIPISNPALLSLLLPTISLLPSYHHLHHLRNIPTVLHCYNLPTAAAAAVLLPF